MPRVFCACLRWPRNKSDKRPDPKYEEGSFGSTGCHSRNLLSDKGFKNGRIQRGDRLIFVQGSKIVFITPELSLVDKDEKGRVVVHWDSDWRCKQKRPLKIKHAMELDLLHAQMINPRIFDFKLIGSYIRSYSQPVMNPDGLLRDYESLLKEMQERLKDEMFVDLYCETFCAGSSCESCERLIKPFNWPEGGTRQKC
jgi:hypothetical protein